MQNLSDKELDELMKKANESQSYTYDEDSWPALADKLDSTPKRGFIKRQAPLLSILLGVVLMSSLYYVVSNQTSTHGNVAASVVPGKKQGEKQMTTAERVTKALTITTDEKALLEVELNTSAERKISTKASSQAERQESSADFKRSNAQKSISAMSSDDGIQQRELKSNVSSAKEQRASPLSPNRENSNSISEIVTMDSAVVEKVEVAEVKNEITEKDSVGAAKEERVRISRFAIKLSASPDFSSESFSQPDAMGWNYGGAVEYQISKAFAVSVGLLNTRKYYTAEDVTYGQYTAEYAEGDCRMWDIPVNVHYYIPSRQSLQLIGSLGFSSYIMRQENYTYYPDETNKYRKYQSEINNENSEWFKVLNLSIAAQLKVSPTMYIQLEPFIKAPLSGLGEGNISLSSFGTFFTVKYQFNTKTTPNNAPKN